MSLVTIGDAGGVTLVISCLEPVPAVAAEVESKLKRPGIRLALRHLFQYLNVFRSLSLLVRERCDPPRPMIARPR